MFRDSDTSPEREAERPASETGSTALRAALDAVAELDEAGLRCVPGEPSPRMLRAAAAAAGISLEQARKAYRAMLDTSE